MKLTEEIKLKIQDKFDKIIMNPPYLRTKHLLIIREALKHTNIVVAVHPSEWLLNKEWEYSNRCVLRRFEDIARKISCFDLLDRIHESQLEKDRCDDESSVLMISINRFDNNTNNETYKTIWKLRYTDLLLSIMEKVKAKIKKNLYDVIDKSPNDSGIRVPLRPMVSSTGWTLRVVPYPVIILKYFKYVVDGKVNGEYYRSYLLRVSPMTKLAYKHFKVDTNKPLRFSVKFNTTQEAENFYDTLNDSFMKYLISINIHGQNVWFKRIPFMDDYTQPWTNERFFDYFNLNEEEREAIVNKIKEEKW